MNLCEGCLPNTIHMKYDTNKLQLNHFYMCTINTVQKTMQFLMCILLLLECIVGAATQHIKDCHNFSSFLFRIKSWWSRALTCILMQNAAIVFFLCAKIIYKPRERDMFALLIYTPFVEFHCVFCYDFILKNDTFNFDGFCISASMIWNLNTLKQH